jgi:hypothetical protein
MVTALQVHALNELLGRELGRRDGRSIFAWKHSDMLFWPAFDTGQKTKKVRTFDVPIIGGGTESCTEEMVVPAYVSERQVRNSAWYVTKLLTAEELIWGWIGKHGDPLPDGRGPSDERLLELWSARFPGAEFPSRGWRVPTDAYLPRATGGDREPNIADTEAFITCVKEQTRLSFGLRLQDMMESEDRKEAAKNAEIGDCVRDAFGAFLNPNPGKRGGFVSFPWTGRDRVM